MGNYFRISVSGAAVMLAMMLIIGGCAGKANFEFTMIGAPETVQVQSVKKDGTVRNCSGSGVDCKEGGEK